MAQNNISSVEYVLRLFFPPRCVCCDMLLPLNKPIEICENCQESLPVLKRYTYANPAGNSIGKIFSAFDYERGIRQAIHNLKFNDTPGNAATLMDLSFMLLKSHLGDINQPHSYDCIIPVPLHYKRKRERGYNQAELLASHMARLSSIPLKKRVLVKTIHTAPQSTLNRDERFQNLKDSYQVKNLQWVQGKYILLVDDIMTTGSTLEQCGKVLRNAGAKHVDAFVMAIRRKIRQDS